MKLAQRTDPGLVAVVCCTIAACDVVFVALILSRSVEIAPLSNVLFPDFLVFDAAVRAYFEGRPAQIYDVDAFTRFQNALFLPDRLPADMDFRPFFYPPTWLLMLLPLGLLGVATAYAVFMAGTVALSTLLVGRNGDWWGWLAVVTSPAAVWVVLAGQNTFLSLALFYGGFRLLERSPAAAGILLGLLSYKPQVWLLVPVALLAARQWRALGWMIGTAAGLALAALAVFGPDVWLAFLDAARQAALPPMAEETFARVYMHMTTPLAAARILGLPAPLAGVLQLGIAVVSIGAVWQAFRHHPSSAARTAVLAAATFVVSPYMLNYDLLLLMPAVVALFRQGMAHGFRRGERLLCLALWLIPTLSVTLNHNHLPIAPLLILAFGALAWQSLDRQPKVELPGVARAS